jgi:hypothetical protein
MSASDYVHVDVAEIVAETDKALLLILDDDDGTKVWVPLSQIADSDNYSKGDKNLTVSITRWIADKLGIEGED